MISKVMPISDQQQARILSLFNKSLKPLPFENVRESLQKDFAPTDDLLYRLVRMGLVRQLRSSDHSNTVSLTKLGHQLLLKHSPEKVLKIACKKPFAGVSSENILIPEQEYHEYFETYRLSLSTKSVSYEVHANSYEAKRFFSQFSRQPDLSKEKDSVIFHIEEVAKTISILINYVVDAADKKHIPIQNVPFLQPLRLATLSGSGLNILGVAYCCIEVIPRDTEWHCFCDPWPGHRYNPLEQTPDTVMTHFSSYLNILTGNSPWQWFFIPWDMRLALKNGPYDSNYYRSNEVECGDTINKILEDRHSLMEILKREKYNKKSFAIEYDAFISYANEDKDFVRPLAESLIKSGFKIWYDEFELKVGDSLRRSIDRGLSKSRFGIVILSSVFFEKNWPQYELDGLVSKEIDGAKVILPIWHKVSKDEVKSYSPTLADKLALNSSILNLKEIISQLTEVLKKEKT